MNPADNIVEGLEISIHLKTGPAITFIKPEGNGISGNSDAFAIELMAGISYPSITKLLNAYLGGKRIELSEGLISTHIIIANALVESDGAGNLLVQVHFGGSFHGSMFIKGRPVFDAGQNAIRLAQLQYDLQSTSILLRIGKSLLQNKIGNELAKRSIIPLQPHIVKAKSSINGLLEKQWTPETKSAGVAQDIAVRSVTAKEDKLLVEAVCTGNISVQIKLL